MQIFVQGTCRRVAPSRVLVDRLVYDRLEIPRHLRIELAERGRFGVGHLPDQSVSVFLIVGRPECQHLVQGQAQRIHIAASIGLSFERLRRHVTQRTEDVAGVRQILLVVSLGQAEISHPHRPLGVQK